MDGALFEAPVLFSCPAINAGEGRKVVGDSYRLPSEWTFRPCERNLRPDPKPIRIASNKDEGSAIITLGSCLLFPRHAVVVSSFHWSPFYIETNSRQHHQPLGELGDTIIWVIQRARELDEGIV